MLKFSGPKRLTTIVADERAHAAVLFAFQGRGEAIAAACARRQAELPGDEALLGFYRLQARQERFHERVFSTAARWVSPKQGGRVPGSAAMSAYWRLLEEALDRGDRAEALLANQIVLEALGETELEKLDQGLDRRGLGFSRLRRIVLAQEQNHHATGHRALQAALDAGETTVPALRARAEDYLELIDRILAEAAPLFEYFNQDVAGHRRRFVSLLPDWLRAAESMQ